MSRLIPALSRGMLIFGAVLILAGLGWGLWTRLTPPPPPEITDLGAVVLAVTAPSQSDPDTPDPTPSLPPALMPTLPPSPVGPTPEVLPDWTVDEEPESASTPPASTPESLPPSLTPPSSTPVAPTPTAAPTATPTPTPTRLPLAENPPTRVVAPAIELDAKVVPMGWETVEFKGKEYTKWVVPNKAAGWHLNSSLPGGGENVVLSGHHNIKGKVFRYVVDLEPGDDVTIYADDVPYTYTVTEKYILKEAGMPLEVRKDNARWIMPTGDERLTLVTCWPYEWPGNTHRVIVVAKPSSDARADSQPSG